MSTLAVSDLVNAMQDALQLTPSSRSSSGCHRDASAIVAQLSRALPDAGQAANSALAGMDHALEALREAVAWPVRYAGAAAEIGVRWPKGLLLHGPPGCGKTAAVHTIARECGAILHQASAASVVGAYTGESERRLRELFRAAQSDAEAGKLVVVFLDEVDTLCPRREAAQEHEARIVGQLLTLLDGTATLAPQHVPGGGVGGRGSAGHLVVVAATSRPNAVDPALRRPGRLEREVLVPVPDVTARASILRLLTRRLPLDSSVDLCRLALECHGYTGADLSALCRQAGMRAIAEEAGLPRANPASTLAEAGSGQASLAEQQQAQQRKHRDAQLQQPGEQQQWHERVVTYDDFAAAMQEVGPSLARGSVAEYIPASWDDIGGLDAVKHKLRQAVEWPLQHADAFDRLGLTPPRGVLLHGPPGCSKTTLVRAAATASGATLIPLSGTQLYSMYVGEGEAILRETFRRARLVAPSIVFLDELDSLVGKRVEGEAASESTARLLSSFLTEMDGLELAQGVLVMGATNRPQALDAALIRPGRFDVVLYVPPPDEPGRLQALRIHTRETPLAPDVDLPELAAKTIYYTGAELAAVCREAAMLALREDIAKAQYVHYRHFDQALTVVQPQLLPADLAAWQSWPQQPGMQSGFTSTD